MRKTIVVGTIGALFASLAFAGGGPQNALVVVNDRSADSQELGHYYRTKRGIPERNLCHVSVDPLVQNLSWSNFQTQVRDPILTHIRNQGLTNQIDYLVLSKDLPSRINNAEGASAALFYGYKNTEGLSSCALPMNTKSDYYKEERAFYHRDTYSGTNAYLVSMLSASNLAIAKLMVDRGTAADGTLPSAAFYLLAPRGDAARNVRYQLFDNYDFVERFYTNHPAHFSLFADYIRDKTNVLGYMTGRPDVPTDANLVFPGALADHLTYLGGYLPASSQVTVWDWINRGYSLSYGTVISPCVYLRKYPDPMLYFWYARGFTAGESYWMSVEHPYQGIFIGDPLAAPFSRPPSVALTNVIDHQAVSNTVALQMVAGANSAGTPPRMIELYVDDVFAAVVTNVAPPAGNILRAVIDGQVCTYETVAGDSLYSAVDGLAGSINGSNLPVVAVAYSDRIMLAFTNLLLSVTSIAYSAAAEAGGAASTPLGAMAMTDRLLPSLYKAREYYSLRTLTTNGANTGDTASCVITLTNGVVSTNLVIASQGETAKSLAGRLASAINNNPALQGTNGVYVDAYTYNPFSSAALVSRANGPAGYLLHVDFRLNQAIPGSGLSTDEAFANTFNDSELIWDQVSVLPRQYVVNARGMLQFWCGQAPLEASYTWDTTALPNGPHRLLAIAKDGSSVESQGRAVTTVVVSNSPLTCVLTAPADGSAFFVDETICIEAAPAGSVGAIAQTIFFVEGKPIAATDAPPYTYCFSATNYGPGLVSVRAWAFDDAGKSAWSDEAMLTVEPLLPPPRIRASTNLHSRSFTLQWDAAERATNYWLDVATHIAFQGDYVSGYSNRQAGATTACVVTGLWPGALYAYRVRAQSPAGLFSADSEIANVTTLTESVLTVSSDYGEPAPPRGMHTNDCGATWTNVVASPDTRGTTQFVCTGWTLAGNEPAAGATNRMTLGLTNDASLAWQWKTQYWLAVGARPNGEVDQTDRWVDAGSTVTIAASAWDYHLFIGWIGDTDDCVMADGQIAVPMDHPRTISASFTLALEIASAHGSPDPAVGVYTTNYGAEMTNTVPALVTQGSTHYLCTGWTLADNEPAAGTTNVMTLVLTNNAMLTWQWKTQFWLAVEAGPHGEVDQPDQWVDMGRSVAMEATPSNHYSFAGWGGDTNGCVITGKRTLAVQWPSLSNQVYTLRRSTNFGADFSVVATGIPATEPLNTYTDQPPADVTVFYSVEVGK